MKIAFLFAGQGAQYVGMAKSLYENSLTAKNVFDFLESLRPGTLDMCFNGPKEDLNRTINTQPCLFAVDIAAAYALEEAGINADTVAGFSLGEIPALAYSGVLSLEDSFKFVCIRAEKMDAAANKYKGGMAAILKLEASQVVELCNSLDNVWAVNFNCPGQTVAAGSEEAIDKLTKLVTENGGRAMRLPVSGAFHCEYMSEPASELFNIINTMHFNKEHLQIYSNTNALPYKEDFALLLSEQIKKPVLWEQTIRNMDAGGIDTYIEVGAGKTLSGLVKRILPDARIYNVEDITSLNLTLEALKAGG